MGAYAGINQAKLLRENRQIFLWQNDVIPAGVAGSPSNVSLSLAVQLERVRSVSYPWGFSVEVAFSGAPGTFEIDVMIADTDDPTHYVQFTTIATVNAFNVGRVDVLTSWAKYVALYMKTLGNAGVAVTAQITR